MVVLTSFSAPNTGVVHEELQTEAFVEETNYGTGTLYITQSEVLWVGQAGNGFKLAYPTISIHAVSRDTSSFPHECLFMMLDIKLDEQEPMIEDEESDEDSTSGSTEVRFVPAEKEHLDMMYQAMCSCQELHPDPEQDDSEDEYFGDDGVGDGIQLSAQGLSNLARMEQMLADGINAQSGDSEGAPVHSNGNAHEEMEDDGQFEDA